MMIRHPFASPRSMVAAAATILLVLVSLLGVRLMGEAPDEALATTLSGRPATGARQAPEPRPPSPPSLAIPCWSCPESAAASLRFQTDLDLLAPLGSGTRNLAEWYSAFTEDGARASEADAIMRRRVDHATLGKILAPGDPFLLEAEPWMDEATMRFYPEVFAVEGFQTKVPNLMLALTLARSWVARGRATEKLPEALVDFRRVIRLGRLLRQDDVMVIYDLIGLAVIRMGAEAMFEQALRNDRLDTALPAAIVASEAPAQKLLSGARMTNAEVIPYLLRGPAAPSSVIPENRFEGMRKLALESPDRRFRVIACASLSLVASFGSRDQQEKSKAVLQALAGSPDTLLASNARWHLTHPIDETRLVQLMAQED